DRKRSAASPFSIRSRRPPDGPKTGSATCAASRPAALIACFSGTVRLPAAKMWAGSAQAVDTPIARQNAETMDRYALMVALVRIPAVGLRLAIFTDIHRMRQGGPGRSNGIRQP